MRCLNCGELGINLSAEMCPKCEVHLPSLLRGCLPSGTSLLHGNYQIEYPLGRGGFGITYRAIDRNLQRPVAIKEFFPQDYAVREYMTGFLRPNTQKQGVYQRGLERFIREGRLLAGLDHPGIVRVYNAFQERDTAYLVMELIDGITLRDELNRQPGRKLPLNYTVDIVTKLVTALDCLHQQHIYHLDLSPDNVMLAERGRVILIDFGSSRQGMSGQTTQAYKEAYAPPEVLNGQGMGAESDVFELGMMLWELLTGERPPSAISRLTSVIADGRDTWRPIGLDEPWAGLVSGAIRLKQQERPQKILAWWPYSKDRATESEMITAYPDRAVATLDRLAVSLDAHNLEETSESMRRCDSNRTSPIEDTPPHLLRPDRSPIDLAPTRSNEEPIPKTVYTDRSHYEPIPITVHTDPAWAIPSGGTSHLARPAGLLLRLGADAIDRTILVVGSYTINFIFQTFFDIGIDWTILLAYYIILGLLYCPTLDSSSSRGTIGKKLMGLMVTDVTGKQISFQRALTRHACKIFSYLTLGAGLLMVRFTSEQQALHDRLAKCLVVKR
jgi:serine/threonine protein kinase